jgi:ATP-dependent protease ClpP protease subunit
MAKVIELSGVVGYDITADNIREQLKESSGESVRFEINSPGGSVFDGIEIYNIIRGHEGETETRLISLGASMGSIIALAGDKKTAEDTAVYMIHNPWGVGIGDYRDLQKDADFFKGLAEHMAALYSKETGIDKAEIIAMMDDESWFFGAEMSKFGIEIIETDTEKDKETALGCAKLDFEACLNRMENDKKESKSMDIAALFGNMPDLNAKNSNKPLDSGDKLTEESMDKTKLKAEFPELYNELVKEGNESAVKAAMENVKEILSIAGISDEIAADATSGIDSGDFAKAEIKKQREARAAIKEPAGIKALEKPAELPKDTAPEAKKVDGVQGEVSAEQKAEIDFWDSAYKKKEAK